MKKLLLALALMIGTAHAGDATLTWVNPTMNMDGTALALTGIARTEIEYGKCNSAKTGFMTTTTPVLAAVPAPLTTGTVSGLAPGAWCFHSRTVGTGGGISAFTGFVNTTVIDPSVPPVPLPPTSLTVSSADRTAYSIVKRVDRLVLAAVGTVAPGTACVTSQQVNGYYVVPRSSVTWSSSVKPDVVVASCLLFFVLSPRSDNFSVDGSASSVK